MICNIFLIDIQQVNFYKKNLRKVLVLKHARCSSLFGNINVYLIALLNDLPLSPIHNWPGKSHIATFLKIALSCSTKKAIQLQPPTPTYKWQQMTKIKRYKLLLNSCGGEPCPQPPCLFHFLDCRPPVSPVANNTAARTSSTSGAGPSASSSSTIGTTSCATTRTGSTTSFTVARLDQFQWCQRLDQWRQTIISYTCQRHCQSRRAPYCC